MLAFKVPQAGLEPARSNEHRILSPACLPIPPPGLRYFNYFNLSEKRDSNPRPRPWQGRALPAELFSQTGCKYKQSFHFSELFIYFFDFVSGISIFIESVSCFLSILRCTIISINPFSKRNSDV